MKCVNNFIFYRKTRKQATNFDSSNHPDPPDGGMGSTGVVRKRFLLSPIRKESNSASPILSPTYSPSSTGGGGGGNSPVHNNEKMAINQIKSEKDLTTICNNITNITTKTNNPQIDNSKKSAIFRGEKIPTSTTGNRNNVANNTAITRHGGKNFIFLY